MSETGYPESKATRKATGGRVQALTVADGQTEPAAGSYFTKEGRDLVALHVDSEFDGTYIQFDVSYDAGVSWKQHAFAGTDPHIETFSESTGVDPAVFAGCPLIRPVLSDAQSGADCVVTGIFRDFRS